ncbi:hypothetical protein E2C01_018732 [Portunus trituberculatus]|uniref:Uncharacterized protein n=1 Tax=Portunus trituberculatus TaxID=210409 RepID=A0A5B7DVA8_PORTR|nr:hypothetical protein [Portunus trituberculatus]
MNGEEFFDARQGRAGLGRAGQGRQGRSEGKVKLRKLYENNTRIALPSLLLQVCKSLHTPAPTCTSAPARNGTACLSYIEEHWIMVTHPASKTEVVSESGTGVARCVSGLVGGTLANHDTIQKSAYFIFFN